MRNSHKLILVSTLMFLAFSHMLNARVATSPPLHFTDVSKISKFNGAIKQKSYSAATADFDKDGYLDILISLHSIISLWKNNKDGTFSNVNAKIIGLRPADTHGVSFIDMNNDTYPDIVVSVGGQRGRGKGNNQIYINNGGESFSRITPDHLIAFPEGRGRSITPADINNDGRLDLLLFNLTKKSQNARHRIILGKGPTSKREFDYNLNKLHGDFAFSAAFGCKIINLKNDNQQFYILSDLRRDSGKIFIRDGTTFREVTRELGIKNVGWTTVVPLDYDNDGDLDLFFGRGTPPPTSMAALENNTISFIINEQRSAIRGFSIPVKRGKITLNIRFEGRISPHQLFIGENKFTPNSLPETIDISDTKLRGKPKLDQENDRGGFLWYDTKGFLNYRFIGGQLLQETEGVIGLPKENNSSLTLVNFPVSHTHNKRNILYKNENGHFTDVTAVAGIRGNGQTFTATSGDFNNDGCIDIYTVNSGKSLQQLNPPNNLFINNCDGTFSEIAEQSHATGPTEGIGSGVITFDYDNDGDLDILLHNGNTIFPMTPGPIVLLRNDTNTLPNSISLFLEGSSPPQAWGARIKSYLGHGKIQLQQKHGLNGFLSTSDRPFYIGLNKKKILKKLTITWPTGKESTILNIKAGSRLIATEPQS